MILTGEKKRTQNLRLEPIPDQSMHHGAQGEHGAEGGADA
jgi:hypothetical protein